ncbi:MAG: ABC transporter permease subunit [Firmicutes bacterium]|nr:ABC transporter permease subunit [Bacillota bacterium]
MSKYKPYLMIAPIMIIILCVFIGALVMGVMQSIGYFPAIGMTDISLKYYGQVFSDPSFLTSLIFSLKTAFISSTIALLLGLLLAYLLLKSNVSDRISGLIYRLPVIVPHSIGAFMIITLFAQSGLFSRIFYNLGLISEISHMPTLLFDKNGVGVILAYVWKATPFIAMVVYNILKSVCGKLEEVSCNLGASQWQTFKYVILPLTLPTLVSNFIIIFTFSFGAFEIPYLLGATSPRALPILAYIEYNNPNLSHRPYAMAINMILTASSLLIVALISIVSRRFMKYRS